MRLESPIRYPLAGEPPFDVVILYNVINHVDEQAVMKLHEGAELGRYPETLRVLRSLLAPGGTLIVSDCARSNLWPAIGLRNRFAPNIEREKHQDPRLWIELFQDAGFELRDARWSPAYPFGRSSANRIFQYLTVSHFVLRFGRGDAD